MLPRPMNHGLAFTLTSMLSTALGIALMQDPPQRETPVVTAARAFVDGLPAPARARALVAFADPTRTEWHYVPREYPGIAFGELDAAGRARAETLLHTVLSERGAAKVDAITALEDVLRELEQQRGAQGPVRDPGRYWLQVLGEPRADGRWGFRLQGHHVSLHFTVDAGVLAAATPAFLGSNPHEVPQGPHRGERILGRAEDLARGLLATCDAAQLAQAVLAKEAPADILAGPGRAPAELGAPQGLPWAAMAPVQQELLWRLVREFVEDHEGAFAERVLQRIATAGKERLCFCWLGSTERGHGHYFRVQGPTVWIEYDNTQNDANHVHSVYRDLERDFGLDPLREHLRSEHAGAERR